MVRQRRNVQTYKPQAMRRERRRERPFYVSTFLRSYSGRSSGGDGMTLSDLFNHCNAQGIRLANVAGELKLRGSDGVITAEILDAAREHKPALLALLPLEIDDVPIAAGMLADR